MQYQTAEPPVVLDRQEGPHGEVVLRQHGELLQIIANGCFLMDTSDGRSERRLVRAAREELGPRTAPSLLIGGLGVGFSLAEAAADPGWGRITVVEREEAIIGWHAPDRPLSPCSAEALRDPRTGIVHADLLAHIREGGTAGHPGVTGDPGPAAGRRTRGSPAEQQEGQRGDNLHSTTTSPAVAGVSSPSPGPVAPPPFDAICLDIDNGPDWTVTDNNGSLYSPDGLAACRARLTPGGVLAVWSAQPSPKFEDALRNAGFNRVRTEEIRVVRGVPDVVHFATKPT